MNNFQNLNNNHIWAFQLKLQIWTSQKFIWLPNLLIWLTPKEFKFEYILNCTVSKIYLIRNITSITKINANKFIPKWKQIYTSQFGKKLEKFYSHFFQLHAVQLKNKSLAMESKWINVHFHPLWTSRKKKWQQFFFSKYEIQMQLLKLYIHFTTCSYNAHLREYIIWAIFLNLFYN